MPDSEVDWDQVAKEFEPDGALRDIYVLGTSISEWQSVYDALRASYLVVLRDNEPLPSDVRDLFRREEPVTLTVDPGGLDAACHFFTEQEIEFDLVPNEITSQADLDRVCEFMGLIARAAGKDAILTMENCPNSPILRCTAATGLVSIPAIEL